jgi:hypothetical protein
MLAAPGRACVASVAYGYLGPAPAQDQLRGPQANRQAHRMGARNAGNRVTRFTFRSRRGSSDWSVDYRHPEHGDGRVLGIPCDLSRPVNLWHICGKS